MKKQKWRRWIWLRSVALVEFDAAEVDSRPPEGPPVISNVELSYRWDLTVSIRFTETIYFIWFHLHKLEKITWITWICKFVSQACPNGSQDAGETSYHKMLDEFDVRCPAEPPNHSTPSSAKSAELRPWPMATIHARSSKKVLPWEFQSKLACKGLDAYHLW